MVGGVGEENISEVKKMSLKMAIQRGFYMMGCLSQWCKQLHGVHAYHLTRTLQNRCGCGVGLSGRVGPGCSSLRLSVDCGQKGAFC